jgi:hypothetical protein
MCVIDRQGKVGMGSSARFLVADSIVAKLQAGQELAEVVAEHTKSDVRAGLGMMGVITGTFGTGRSPHCCLSLFNQSALKHGVWSHFFHSHWQTAIFREQTATPTA